jgi:hypothetical protein
MNEPRQPAEKSTPPRPQKVLVEFIEALHRIIKIGTYYPQGHAALDRAAHLFQNSLQKITEETTSATIEIKGAALAVEDQEITANSPAISEIITIFRDLGIGRMEIDQEIPLKDLLQMIKTLLQHRSQLQGIKQFTKARLVDLPTTVRVFQQEFLVEETGHHVASSEGETDLEAVFRTLEEQGLDQKQISQCRAFLNSMDQRFAIQPIKLKGLPAISWQDVRKLLAKIVGSGFQFSESAGKALFYNDLNALSAIFDSLKQQLDDRESLETINLLVSAFNRGQLAKKSTATSEEGGKKGLRAKDKGTDLTIGEIQTFVGGHDSTAGPAISIKKADRSDELAILLELLQFTLEAKTIEGLHRNLSDILKASLSPRMVDVLIKGTLHLTKTVQDEWLEETVAFIARQLRGSATFSSQSFLVVLCRQLPSEVLELLWTTLINELLAVGCTAKEGHVFKELARLAASIPIQAMLNRLLRLEEIDAIREKRIASNIFDPELKEAYPVYAVLLETSMRTTIASRVLEGLRAAPPDWLISAVTPLLDSNQPHHQQILYTYLHIAQRQKVTVALQVMAGNLVVERLAGLEETAKNAPWVTKTIEATPQLQVEGTRELLERIVSEKKFLVIPKWPTTCRQAATDALQRLKSKPLS